MNPTFSALFRQKFPGVELSEISIACIKENGIPANASMTYHARGFRFSGADAMLSALLASSDTIEDFLVAVSPDRTSL
jgi:hypothetical protein